MPDAVVGSDTGPLVHLMRKQLYAWVSKTSDDFNRAIRGAIVSNDDLKILERLMEDALDTSPDKSLVVVGWDDDADDWGHYAVP